MLQIYELNSLDSILELNLRRTSCMNYKSKGLQTKTAFLYSYSLLSRIFRMRGNKKAAENQLL